jgi:pimeloyl-ACP methyl ester carboxylesterase
MMVVATPLAAATQPAAYGARIVAPTDSAGETYVLVSGLVGGVAGYRKIAERLTGTGARVVLIDPYHLSIDSADVSFAALARRVVAVMAREGIVRARLVGHAHGGGVMLRVAAMAPERVDALYFLDVGALATSRSRLLATSLRLVPIIARIPGGRDLLRRRYLHGIRENAGRSDWLDSTTARAYADPMFANLSRVVALAIRIARTDETEPISAVVARIRVPCTVILGAVPHDSGPDAGEIDLLSPLGALVRIERLAGVGHFPHEEAPDVVTRLLLDRPLLMLTRATVPQHP